MTPAPSSGAMPVVVCVDDEPDVLRAIGRTFRNEPYAIRTTTAPLEAVEWLKTLQVGVLIADQRMPHMRGTELLQQSKDLSPETARVLLTAYPGDPVVLTSMKLFDLALVGKPWDDEALKTLVRARLQERGLIP